MSVKTEICYDFYTKELLRANPDKIFVFGDNMKRYGKKGQAVIRDEPNAFGVATKRYPSMDEWAFFSDKQDEANCLINDLRELYRLSKSQVIVFPSAGLGTGLSKMPEKSPILYSKMMCILQDHFNVYLGSK